MIQAHVDVAKLLGRLGIEAREDGNEFLAKCPAHEDHAPSWSINRHTTRHNCFACGFGGVASTLVIHVLDMASLAWTRADAWEWMRRAGVLEGAGDLGLSVELYLRRPAPKGRMVLPAGVRIAPVADWPTPARRYLAERLISGIQATRWGLGVAVDGRLEGRVVFPVRGRDGALRSYSARSFVGSEIRYLTPHSSEHPDLGALFGESRWPEPGARARVVVVEGAIKALAVERAIGIGTPVAGLLGAMQSRNSRVVGKLATFAEVVILTDADMAGQVAGDALYGALARHTSARRVVMPGLAVDDAPPGEVSEVIA